MEAFRKAMRGLVDEAVAVQSATSHELPLGMLQEPEEVAPYKLAHLALKMADEYVELERRMLASADARPVPDQGLALRKPVLE